MGRSGLVNFVFYVNIWKLCPELQMTPFGNDHRARACLGVSVILSANAREANEPGFSSNEANESAEYQKKHFQSVIDPKRRKKTHKKTRHYEVL